MTYFKLLAKPYLKMKKPSGHHKDILHQYLMKITDV